MSEKELDLKYMFDRFIKSNENFNETVKELNSTLIKHNEQAENHEVNNSKEHGDFKKLLYWSGGIFAGLFTLSIVAFIILAFGKEFIGQENVMLILKHVLKI